MSPRYNYGIFHVVNTNKHLFSKKIVKLYCC
uniref:Uncharacterized protein n=1 Tax=Arundo donax TaxID=35708 RepID=A0A0A8ZL66_ARUDO